jgi:hypothetical protein
MSVPTESRLSTSGKITLACIVGFAVGVAFSYHAGQIAGLQIGFVESLQNDDANFRRGEEFGLRVGFLKGYNQAVDEKASHHKELPPAQTELEKSRSNTATLE